MKKPKPPIGKIIRQGVGHFCKKCGSSPERIGFLGLFRGRVCINPECKSEYNDKP